MDVFRFKQFQVTQHQNVHRVGTDGVLLGAWVDLNDVKSALDIGAGTGVIALMLAQRLGVQANITAIEPNAEAFDLAKQNIIQSPFNNITIIQSRLQDFSNNSLFDLIISNPPYFENSLKPPTDSRTFERHTDLLVPDDLLAHSKKLLKPEGKLIVVLPVAEGNLFIDRAKNVEFHLASQCAVHSKEGKPQERWLLAFTRQPIPETLKTTLTIMNSAGEWTNGYKELTREFYLNF